MSSRPLEAQAGIDFAADLIRQSKHTVALTGAGISTPSGIPDFRSSGTGLWSRDEPLEVASLSAFRTKPRLFFEWFRPLARQMFESQPNPAHIALAKLEAQGFLKTIVTQNVDTLHQRSGSKTVIEMHGTMQTLTCTQCYHQVQASTYIAEFVESGNLPACPQCNALLKPDVILFGEQLPQAALFAAQRAARSCDLMLVVGSSLEVLPVAGLPMQALDRGAHLIIINNAPTYLNVRADAVFYEDVADILPAIVERVLYG